MFYLQYTTLCSYLSAVTCFDNDYDDEHNNDDDDDDNSINQLSGQAIGSGGLYAYECSPLTYL